jgi:hypothetical protein
MADKTAMDFKFEAGITVFGTKVDLKPLEGDEIGFRAAATEPGISITKAKLEEAGLIDANGEAAKLIPDNTEVRTIMFNKKTKGVEFAVKATFGDDFILNKYKKLFELNTVSIYLNTAPETT